MQHKVESEIEVLNIEVLNKAETPPIDITTDGNEIGEEHRLISIPWLTSWTNAKIFVTDIRL